MRDRAASHSVAPTWIGDRRIDGLRFREAVFTSPFPDLPDACRAARLAMIEPPHGADRVCLLMAASNDHGWRSRGMLARRLARLGIASVLLENPYYGTRRLDPEARQPVPTVLDMLIMGSAAVAEGRAILRWLAAHAPWTVGVSGYSMGGNIAALTSAESPVPVATAPLAAAHSPGPVFTEGILGEAVAWEALGGLPTARHKLAAILGTATVLDLSAPAHTRRAILLVGRGDGYVPPATTEAIVDHWHGAELRRVRGGHVSVYSRSGLLAATIADAFERFEAP